jgi:hypothetical protein
MKKLIVLIFLWVGRADAQAVFQTSGSGSGNWDDAASWTLVSGTSSYGYPVSGDTATISGGAAITVDNTLQCNALTISGAGSLIFTSNASILTISNALTMSGASTIDLSLGLLTVTGNATVGGASTITISQAALTVVGLFALTSTTVGNTLLDVEGGAFSCVGGMTLSGLSATRTTELRIAGGAVNLAGGLLVSSANNKVDFTGAGTLSLAGVVSFFSTSSFVAGNGRVIYFNLPGSSQTVAPLTYYRLAIAGVGQSTKEINGSVTVTDTLTLLTDTLEINSGGSLTLSDGATLVRTAGKLVSTPTFAGSVNLVYNDVGKDTTGPEMPTSPAALQQLTIDDFSGIALGAPVTVNGNLNLTLGPLITGSYGLTLANPNGGSGATDPGVTVANGYILGTLVRTIGASAGLRVFPMGFDNQDYREFDINYTTAPTAGGNLKVWAIDTAAPAQSGLPLTDDGVTITHVAEAYWEADAGGGLAGGQYTTTLTGENVGSVSDVNTLRIVKRPSTGGAWILDGTDGTHGGTDEAPVVSRTGMSGFSQFSFGSDNSNTLPITLLSFTGQAQGSRVLLNWTTTSENDNLSFTVEHSLDGQVFTALGTVAGAGTTEVEQTYSYVDDTAVVGANYYQLKQTDADGNFTYSQVIVCNVAGEAGLLIYPNPVSSTLTISGVAGGSLRLLDATGRSLGDLKAGANDVSGLAAGIYYVRYSGKLYAFLKH